MNSGQDSFIDAYGIVVNHGNETAALPAYHQSDASRAESTASHSHGRFSEHGLDLASQPSDLRGPHFDSGDAGCSEEENLAAGQQPCDSQSAVWDSGSIVVDMGFVGNLGADGDAPSSPKPEQASRELIDDSASSAIQAVPAVVETPDEVGEPALVAQPESDESDLEKGDVQDEPVLMPAWEVDRFHWPDEVEQLFETQADYFDFAGKKLLAASQQGLKVLAVTSARSGEGSTTMAMCLARAAANAGSKVTLLDANLRNPELGDRLGVDFSCGWQVAAVGETPLAEAAIAGLEENITLLPSSRDRVADVQCITDVLQHALIGCDLLIIDAGQEDLGDTSKSIDGAIIVRDVRTTSEQRVLKIAALLKDHGVKAVGVAENFGLSERRQFAAAA